MRFCLTLYIREKVFPIEYRKVILSYIKNAISKCNNGKYYEHFFKDTKQKDYCFSVILPNPTFTKNEIILSGNEIKVLFSTNNNSKIGFILFSAFIAQKNKSYPLPNNNFMILKNINNKKQEEILNSKAIFKTTLGSGLCVREHDKEGNRDTYYVYNDEKFREKLKVVLVNQILNAGFTEEEANAIKINPIKCKKVVVKHYRRYIDTTTGIFEIQANNKILQHFYDVGIGSRKSMGFGMIDLVTQDLL
ncbi:CRISPR-associated endoribonuclease Cas6 [Clostridium botulinum]|nr:CRISPR-associated endoribonuclease Cas6 [Clostridium botulinum]MCS4476766.1 CRISPR-associated endoribonuclease Cas6 [Clostridium botulinum]